VSSIPSGFRQTEPSAANDAWVVTISVLEALTSQDDYTDVAVTSQITPRRSRMRQRSATVEDVPARYRPNATATVVERVTDRSILVNWCDSTSCHYCDQLWTRKSARSVGHCALTGKVIARGDVVYGPYTRAAHRPANEKAMILASSLEPTNGWICPAVK
jgi:hypothetical protein